jgi:hypothetical protein
MDNLLNSLDEDPSMAGSWILMDNARVHRREALISLIGQRGYHLHFLSPYSYMLNPVEFIFSKVKSVVRRELAQQFGNTQNLQEIILAGVDAVSSNDCCGYMIHVMRNMSLAVENYEFGKYN